MDVDGAHEQCYAQAGEHQREERNRDQKRMRPVMGKNQGEDDEGRSAADEQLKGCCGDGGKRKSSERDLHLIRDRAVRYDAGKRGLRRGCEKIDDRKAGEKRDDVRGKRIIVIPRKRRAEYGRVHAAHQRGVEQRPENA